MVRKNYEGKTDYYRRKQPARNKKRKEDIRKLLAERKDVPCEDCDHKYPTMCMEFDHVRGEKKFNVAESTGRMFSDKTILEEIAKCEVVCANCHRIRTASRLGLIDMTRVYET